LEKGRRRAWPLGEKGSQRQEVKHSDQGGNKELAGGKGPEVFSDMGKGRQGTSLKGLKKLFHHEDAKTLRTTIELIIIKRF
jgi:hypothetical protein